MSKLLERSAACSQRSVMEVGEEGSEVDSLLRKDRWVENGHGLSWTLFKECACVGAEFILDKGVCSAS